MCNIQKHNYPLASLTTWHIGGVAERYFMPNSLEALQEYFCVLPVKCPITWLGLGSNVLIRDGGIDGVVISTRKLSDITITENRVFAMAGVPCAKLARVCAQAGLSGLEFFAGIPGTVGGALRMNAGAFDGETWDRVSYVLTIDRKGQLTKQTQEDFQIDYRQVIPKSESKLFEGFIGASFMLSFSNQSKHVTTHIQTLLKKRQKQQPIGTFNCGSVFRNPPEDYAARLIERAGLKGARKGFVVISQKHANFIINEGNGTSRDVESLIGLISSEVFKQFKINLKTEVRILGKKKGGG